MTNANLTAQERFRGHAAMMGEIDQIVETLENLRRRLDAANAPMHQIFSSGTVCMVGIHLNCALRSAMELRDTNRRSFAHYRKELAQ